MAKTHSRKRFALAVALALVLVLVQYVFAALTTQNLNIVTSTDLATTLAGPGITVLTPTIALSSPVATKLSAGKFAGGLSIGGTKGLGFDTGVILSTGSIATAAGANNSARAGTNFNGPGDAALTALLPTGSSTFDATVFEFDFVPDKNRVFIQYVFASEEYNEFVFDPRGFSDVFAFFVNGVNCATIGNQIVSINTINNGNPFGTLPNSHPEYFINNDFRVNQNPPPPLTTQMDGLTKVLTCKAPVVANATNHLRMAIADAGDNLVDSVVFLRESSFTTTPPVEITKRTNTTDYAYAADGPYVLMGTPVRWTYTVKNTGNDNLSNVVVTDVDNHGNSIAVDCGPTPPSLVPDQSVVCVANGTATKGAYTNVSAVSAISSLIGDVSDSSPGHYFGADPKIKIATKTSGTTNPTLFAGDPVDWTYEVTNTGNVPLSNITVTDDKGVTVNCSMAPGLPPITQLAAGQSLNCSAVGVVQPGTYSSTGRVSGSVTTIDVNGNSVPVTVNDASPIQYFGADPKLSILKTTDGTDNNSAPGPLVLVGDDIAWKYSVTNTGNVALAGVTVVDDRVGAICTVGALALLETKSCNKTGTAERDQHTDNGNGSGSFTGTFKTKTVSAADPDSYFGADPQVAIVAKTQSRNNDASPGPYVAVGEQVKWSYEVSNTGNVALSAVWVTDAPLGTVCSIGTLAVGALDTLSCHLLGTAQKDQYTNIGTANATIQTVTSSGTLKTVPVTKSDTDHYFGADPQIAIVTRTQSTNNNTTPGPYVLTGLAVKWTYSVTNTGNVPLTGVMVKDDQIGDICGIASLAMGASSSCDHLGVSKKDQYTNLGTASSSIETINVDGQPTTVTRSFSDVDHYFGADPHIAIVAKTNSTDNNSAPGPYVLVGDPVKWVYSLTNDGNVPLSNVTVSDDRTGAVCTIPALAMGAAASCDKLGKALKDQYTNIGSASSELQTVTTEGQLETVTRTNSDVDHYFGADPQIAIVTRTQSTNNNTTPGPYVLTGLAVKWTYSVTNTGNVPLTGVTVKDDQIGDICSVGSLAVGASSSCDHLGVSKKDQYTNLGTASSSIETVNVDGQPTTVTRSFSDVDHYFGADPHIAIVAKTNSTDNNSAPGPYVLVGDPVKWVYSLTNDGNVPLSNVTVSDDRTGAVCTIPSLAMGAAASCDKLGKALKDQYTNIGSASSELQTVTTEGQLETVTRTNSDVDHYFGADPRISIVKLTNGTNNDTAPGLFILVGDPVRWTYKVTNVGNVPLTDVSVVDDKEGPICTIGALAVAATRSCEKFKAGDYPDRDYGDKDGSRHDYDGKAGGGYGNDHDNDRGGWGDRKSGPYVDEPTDKNNKNDDGDHEWDFSHNHDGDHRLKRGAQKGQYRNIGTAFGRIRTVTVDGQFKIVTVSDSNVDYYFGAEPSICIIKKTNGTNNDEEPGRGILVGRPVTWTYEVRNEGNVPLNVQVTDDKLGPIACPLQVLGVGAGMTCTATGKARLGQYENVGTAVGTISTYDTEGRLKIVSRTDRDKDHYFGAEDTVFFVIGDKERHRLGDDVDFWGAQWWKSNSMSGTVSSGVASFKGFATDVTLGPGGCGGNWLSRPGNSSSPPDRIPAFVTIIVTSDVVKNGSAIGGTIKELLVVRQDGGYASNPGHAGSGPVFTTICGR